MTRRRAAALALLLLPTSLASRRAAPGETATRAGRHTHSSAAGLAFRTARTGDQVPAEAEKASAAHLRGSDSALLDHGAAAAHVALLREPPHYDLGDGKPWTTIRSPPVQHPVKATDEALPTKGHARRSSLRRHGMYGGAGESHHLGGFLQNDTQSWEPLIWEFMIKIMGVTSVLDVGCGRGISTKWFLDHGCRVLCVEGTEDGVKRTVLPSMDLIVNHDFTRGPWWPEQSFDAVWVSEFIEHVEEKYMDNWLSTLRSAHYIFSSHGRWGGHHHVAIHHDWWWVEKFASRGFTLAEELSHLVRGLSLGTSNYMKGTALVFRNDRNVYFKPMLGPGSELTEDTCEHTASLLSDELLLRICVWEKNPFIPWTAGCKAVCYKPTVVKAKRAPGWISAETWGKAQRMWGVKSYDSASSIGSHGSHRRRRATGPEP